MFEMTPEGYIAARAYLQKSGKWHKISDQDGFSIIHYANWLKGKYNE